MSDTRVQICQEPMGAMVRLVLCADDDVCTEEEMYGGGVVGLLRPPQHRRAARAVPPPSPTTDQGVDHHHQISPRGKDATRERSQRIAEAQSKVGRLPGSYSPKCRKGNRELNHVSETLNTEMNQREGAEPEGPRGRSASRAGRDRSRPPPGADTANENADEPGSRARSRSKAVTRRRAQWRSDHGLPSREEEWAAAAAAAATATEAEEEVELGEADFGTDSPPRGYLIPTGARLDFKIYPRDSAVHVDRRHWWSHKWSWALWPGAKRARHVALGRN